MGKKLAFWGDCNGYGYKIIRILEELGGINVSNYGATEVTSLYYINEKNNITGVYNGDLDKEKYVIMTYHDFIAKYPFQVYDIVYATDNHEEGRIVEIVWDETKGRMRYLVDFENTTSWVFVDDIFCYEAKDNSDFGTAIKPMKVKSNAVKLVGKKVVDNLEEGKTMNKKLAIKGHSTRGDEVIELLEMMGGKNRHNLNGLFSENAYYLIGGPHNDEILGGEYMFGNENIYWFTLEEFLKKHPFKVGDIVDRNIDYVSCVIDNMRWNSEKCCVEYHLNHLNGGECGWHVSDCLIKPKNEDVIIGTKIESTGFMQMGKTVSLIFNSENYEDEVELQLGDYEIEVRDGKTYAVKKKPKYPNDYEECVRIAKNIHGYDIHIDVPAYGELMESFVKLLICRDAYWKIAGEEMGMGYSWKYDMSKDEFSYAISYQYGCIEKNEIRHKNAILVFPIKELRDAFYENFKDLIEQCKELL